ncbi:MAG: ROK family protein, partial [Proteobacteria bacterium]|nr:ROK family protein [Pseudomonadota bacterium]
PATTEAIMPTLWKLIEPLGDFDRVSVGFPGVVVNGVTITAPNLDASWANFALAKEIETVTGKPARVINDAGVQGYGLIEGVGVEMVITLGTGLGCAVYHDGVYIPNLELAHHPFGNRDGDTYEEYVGKKALDKIGKKKWNKRVRKVIDQILPIWNPRRVYLGGGNVKHLKIGSEADKPLPANVVLGSNTAGLLGGIALWR